MGKNWEEGELFVWGDDGLVPADAPSENARAVAEHSPDVKSLFETTLVRNAVEPSVRRVGRGSGMGEIVTVVDDISGIVRTAPKVLPRRQWSTYTSDDDYCNDLEELERRRAGKKSARQKKERPSLFARAIGALARRDYSRRDLEAKLRRSLAEEENPDEVGRVLDRLEGAGYLSDARFAETRVRSRARLMGDARIRRELRQCGVSSEHVDSAMEEIEESEEVRAYRLWARRFGELPKDRKERDRQVRFLMYRGFSMSAVCRVLKGSVEPPDDMV